VQKSLQRPSLIFHGQAVWCKYFSLCREWANGDRYSYSNPALNVWVDPTPDELVPADWDAQRKERKEAFERERSGDGGGRDDGYGSRAVKSSGAEEDGGYGGYGGGPGASGGVGGDGCRRCGQIGHYVSCHYSGINSLNAQADIVGAGVQ
jgi:hypothetical protein